MKTYQTDQISNIVVCGNPKSGKTTLVEAMLFEGGVIERRGAVESRNTVSDYNEIEHENENSVFATVLYTEYAEKKINIIDTPGLDDFSGGLITALRPADSALMLINGQHGVEIGTEIQGRHLESHEKPVIVAVNQLDHDKANFEKVVETLKQSYGSKAVIVQYPVSTGEGFNSFIDVVKMKMYNYPADGGNPEISDIPGDQADRAEELRNELIEAAAENDENLMETFFDKGTLDEEEMLRGIKLGISSRNMFPVLCISAKKNMGVGRLLEFIATAAPGPHETAPAVTKDGDQVKCDSSGPASVFVFKTSLEQHIGEINFFKVMSGEITESMDLVNTNNSSKERFSQLLVVAGKTRNKVSKLVAGDIGATVKLKNTKANHTLTAPGKPVEFEPIVYPEPKFRTAIKAKSESDDEKLGEALSRMHDEDPTIVIEYSKELKQIIVYGQGEYHLNILKWHLDNIFKIETDFITPKIPYRETITKTAQATYRHKKQSGGAGQFGEVHMVIEPYAEDMPDPVKYKVDGKEINVSVRGKEEHKLPWGGMLVYFNCIVGGSIDARFMPAILKGIMEKMEEGPLTGSYARDIRVSVYDGKMHPVDSNEISFKLAGRNAFREAFKNAAPRILEPIYDVEVLVPSERMGDVMSDLQGRRAMIEGMTSEKGFEKIKARVPLAEMAKYSTALSSLTNGRATYTMKMAKYETVPGDLQEKLLKAYEAEQEEE
ncbi:MAG: elongation factor G [Marinilabiliales bacterium]|nr:MAG: elongation factor G [Marinilabiliales bacterium]